MSYLTCLQHICTMLANINLARGQCYKWYSCALYHALLPYHSVSRHNYERHFPFRIRIIKKQVIRVQTWSLHYIFQSILTIYSTWFERRIVEAHVSIMNANIWYFRMLTWIMLWAFIQIIILILEYLYIVI